MNEFKSGCHPIVSDAFLGNYITGAGGYATLNNHIIKSPQDQVKMVSKPNYKVMPFYVPRL